MAARTTAPASTRGRRSALWPYLVMPLIVLVVFYALSRLHRHSANTPASMPAPPELQHSRP